MSKRHIPRTSGVGRRQVLRPFLNKAFPHRWAYDRDSNGKIIPHISAAARKAGTTTLPTREVGGQPR